MVHIYYHIYAIDGVESIIDEQLTLIKKHFDFPYILNVGISLSEQNTPITNILSKFDKVRDVRAKGNEFTTLDLIENDKEYFGNSDYILYLHTKGASKQSDINYKNIMSWRRMMNYFNIEKVHDVFKIFEITKFNTYGVLLGKAGKWTIYSGNFWWSKSEYIKTIKLNDVVKNRFNAEIDYIQNGIDWNPYSAYTLNGVNHYHKKFKRDEYAK